MLGQKINLFRFQRQHCKHKFQIVDAYAHNWKKRVGLETPLAARGFGDPCFGFSWAPHVVESFVGAQASSWET